MNIPDELITAAFAGTNFGDRARNLEDQKRFLA